MRVLVLGSSGMAGHVMSLCLKANGYTVDTISANNKIAENSILLDVTETDKLREYLDSTNFEVVINCIGLLVQQSEQQKDLAVYIKSFLPRFLESHFKDSETKIIHISTDGVFSGKNPPYREDSEYDGSTFYARTKSLGEIDNSKDLTLRTSIIGPELKDPGNSLFDWFYKQKGVIPGYTNSHWNGVTTIVLAQAVNEAIRQNISGIYHLAQKNSITKYDLFLKLKEIFKKDNSTITPVENLGVNMTLISTRKDFDFTIPSYEIMIKDMKVWINKHQDLYAHYK